MSKLKCDNRPMSSPKARIHLSKYLAVPVYAGGAQVFVQTAPSPPALAQGILLHVYLIKECRAQIHRSILADTEQLHRKISEMGQRIRQLEDALAILQSIVSTEPHPLLGDGLLSIKSSPVKYPDPLAETMDAFGTLTIGDSGESKYFGPSAGSEVRSSTLKRISSYNAF